MSGHSGATTMSHPLPIARLGLPAGALAGQVAVVSGAGRGIGRETARALSYLGAAVVVAEIDEASGAQTAELLRAAGGRALAVPTDVADEGSVAALCERTLAEFKRVDVLVNGAILSPVAALLETDVALWDRVIAVNLRGTFLMCKAFLPAMLARARGTIVNMVSADAMPYLSAYIASKRAIAGLSQSLAPEVGERGVRVIAFGPGLVDTPGLRESGHLLAARLGMSEEQFFSLSLHPAYEGLMPAADAGAATAYLVARLADEYHGEVVDGYTVLERAGYLQAPPAGPPGAPAPVAARRDVGTLARAIDLARQLGALVAQTDAEFNRLPVVLRPLARGGFKRQAGQSTADWRRTAAALTARLERIEAREAAALSELLVGYRTLAGLLGKLAAYYRGAAGQAARFTKDQEFLRRANRIASEREATVRALEAALRELMGA